jgi:hypothetical protein
MTDHLRQLDAIGTRLAGDPQALALLALGSVGQDRQRLDEHSDLDFFVVATDPEALLSDLRWLGNVQWWHRDTPDGCKALVEGLFHEFAVFTPDRFPGVLFEPGVFVWVRKGFDTSSMAPSVPEQQDGDWLCREILSNLYVGLHRWLRGERPEGPNPAFMRRWWYVVGWGWRCGGRVVGVGVFGDLGLGRGGSCGGGRAKQHHVCQVG